MNIIGIVANGPRRLIPDLNLYKKEIDIWIGADKGALRIIEANLNLTLAIGDFDSTVEKTFSKIKHFAKELVQYPEEKDFSDIELALEKAYEYEPLKIYLFGSTGGRLDHELANIRLLYSILEKGIRGYIIDNQNRIELKSPGRFDILRESYFRYISFIPFSSIVKGLTLEGFYYPLVNKNLKWGSTLSISNRIILNKGTVSHKDGYLLVIESRDEKNSEIIKAP